MKPPASAPRVIGIDDWAWRRGQHTAPRSAISSAGRSSICCPTGSPATVEAWLRAQPQIEVGARDQNGGYDGAVTGALPQAVQVADPLASPRERQCLVHLNKRSVCG